MLACARLGAIHSVVFGGFAAAELAKRIDDATPKLMLCASCGIEGAASSPTSRWSMRSTFPPHKHRACVVFQRPQAGRRPDPRPRSTGFRIAAETGATPPDPVPVAATDPLYILYTSGTTGNAQGRGARQWRPRGRARVNSMAHIYGIGPGDVFWAAATSAGSWAIPISSMPRCSPAARRCCSRASRSAHPMPAPSGARSRPARGRCLLHRPHRHPRHAQGGPRRRVRADIGTGEAARDVPRRRTRDPIRSIWA
jgi:hypothetical protein